ncbi:hypothetical protein Poli38472_004099 [Pythium oligandrum]|uniref:RING-type E3 ubiquitin transferase n=1 Tax=Pythium oligandrum TaxID=41045 RepID=A0A8K1CNH1_PYTOL|nr:hypothetical protein Poli38472_004099 [Pythium oligandrum]|eukprot:TMW66334.1 hypothetical protein Poli38472_004099 [Pythium oligandrum]
MADEESDWYARYGDVNAVNEHQGGQNDAPDDKEAIDSDHAGEDAQERAVLGDSCPICLEDLLDPVMIRPCYHVYCLACLGKWVTNLSLHGARQLSCPLCKSVFDSVYADVVSETDYRVLRVDRTFGIKSTRQSRGDAETQRRSTIYRSQMRLVQVNGLQVDGEDWKQSVPKRVKVKGQYEAWVARELRVIVGVDVDLTVLMALIEHYLLQPSPMDCDGLVAELEAFLFDDAAIFVRELAYFVGSRLNIQAYDAVVTYGCAHGTTCSIEDCMN